MTQVLAIDSLSPQAEIIARAADVLRQGGLVAYPTETVYGLAASAFLVDSVARVYDVKQRPFHQALPVQIGDRGDILTLPTVSLTVTGGSNTIGLRMPDHPVALAVLRAFGAPLVCTSANLTGRPSPMSAADVLEDLDGVVDLVLDGGPTSSRVASTVLDVSVRPARLLREGRISRADLVAFLPLAP